MKVRHLERELWLPRPIVEIFTFFANPANLETLTPPWLKFQILTPRPLEMFVGTLIDYRLRVRGVPMRWQSEITVWEPPFCFTDEQRRGPYRLWQHDHRFIQKDCGTAIIDTVRYAVPFDFLTHRLLVRPDLARIFDFREQKLRELFSEGS